MVGEAGPATIHVGRGQRSSQEAVQLDTYEQFVARVREAIDAALGPWLVVRVSDARARGADVGAVAEALRELVLRGGKRMRAVLLAAAYEGYGGEGGAAAVTWAGVSMEFLQAYLLVHDDWMDGDEMRRGGPSVPEVMRACFPLRGGASAASPLRGPLLADAASVLAGDLAAAWAHQALLELELQAGRVLSAAREMARVEEEVVEGQVLDVLGRVRTSRELEAMYALKTASYTVRCPLVMGARLAGAGDLQVGVMAAFAEPLGVAFQLRDDMLGMFGDPVTTGKSTGGDLRKGKHTALIVEAMRDARASALLERVLGRPDASEGDVAAAISRIEECGARARVEERIGVLVRDCRAALERAELAPKGRALLDAAVVALTERNR